MKSIDSLPGIATMGHPLIPPGPHAADRTPRELVGIMADRFGRPSGESWRGRVDGPSSTRWRPGRYGWSAECRARTERQLLECFVTANDPDAFRVLIERHGPMVLAVCRNVLRSARRRGRLPGYVPGLGQGRAHNQAQLDHRPVAPSSGPPPGKGRTPPGLNRGASRHRAPRRRGRPTSTIGPGDDRIGFRRWDARSRVVPPSYPTDDIDGSFFNQEVSHESSQFRVEVRSWRPRPQEDARAEAAQVPARVGGDGRA